VPGPTVVLVHGAFADASGFAGVIRELTGFDAKKDAAVQIPSGRYSLVENGVVPALSGCTATGG
jgi:hypothetical protein